VLCLTSKNRERRHSSLGFLSPVVFEEWRQTLF
jgi:transposase InsO family protein